MGAIAAIGGAVLGGVAGSQKDKATQTSQGSSTSGLILSAQTQEEKDAEKAAFNQISGLQSDLKGISGFTQQDQFAKLIQELITGPSAERIQQSNQLTDQLFAQQQNALNQSFDQQNVNFSRRAAQLGRSQSDPILNAKLAQEQIRQQQNLSSAKTSFAAQEAQQGAGRSLQGAISGISGLQQNAIQNRQAVFGLGFDFSNSLKNFRIQTADRFGTNQNTTQSESGGGLKGAITGAMGGAGAGFGAARSFSSPAPVIVAGNQAGQNYNNFGFIA